MKIDKKTFIELLVQKTGLKPDEVEKQFQELTDRIIAASKRGKALEIKGFGMFYFNKQKELTFEPAEEFKTEVNFKYAGMEPVEVQPESKTDPKADDPVNESAADSDDVFGIEDEEAEAGASTQPEAETKSSGRKKKKSTSDQPKKEKEESTIDVFGKDEESDEAFFENLIQDPQEQVKKRGKKELKKAGTAPKGSGKTEKTGPSKPPSKTVAKKKDPITVVMLVMLAFLGLAGILFAITYFTTDDVPTPDIAVESAPPVAPVPAEQDATEP
ncbi:MAG: HU family DNA-binding protein, partial [Balneolaceae bacterium]